MSQIATLLMLWTSAQAEPQNPSQLADANRPDPVAVIPEKDNVPEALVQLGSGQVLSSHALVMDKANRTLSVWKQDGDRVTFVTAVPADFGRNGGNKSSEGDHKTPEGIYFFQEMKEGPTLNFEEYGVRAFTMDYPNYFDQRDKKSGNGIWLHAIPDSKSLLRGSRGCVVVRNDVIKAISPYITVKRTPILIQNAVKYVNLEVAAQLRRTWQTWLANWRDSWQNKNLDQYISHYGSAFKALGMNVAKWREYKKILNEKYEFIKVATIEPVVIVHGNELLIRFRQDYKSDKNADSGEKTLYLRREGDSFKILGEEWRPLPQAEVVANH
ncbi:MAG: murein L,D-transpeptidase family protein [Bdellovibrionales bacterium]